MFKKYHVTILAESSKHTLTYDLETHRPAQKWAEIISNYTPNDIRSTLDPFRGSKQNLNKRITRLRNLIDELNQWLPEKILNYWDNDNPNDSLNKLHVHFPESEKNETDELKRKQLAEYNDLIHELEFILSSKNDRMYLLVCFDNPLTFSLEENDYQYFTPNRNFGDLFLHYPHVGRHPLEIAVANDTDCPSDQIICQNMISGDHCMRFSDFHPDDNFFKNFYYSSGINWPYSLNDPKLAVGFIKMGTLSSVDNNSYDKEDVLTILKSSYKIENWLVE
jgi:hypothetical protein